ncbi:AhpC TSA family protein [Fructilactobacillus fructivorans]|uniref:redoxin domain-containing protein n=1 Tax=Fructilactobacillus fructivorans TaxID=1614 RepID=UPI0007138679|nr:AhpC TSA family protein [Fructilactobacillus fructivorans]
MKIKLGGLPVSWLMGNDQPKVGDYLPQFTVKNADGKDVTTNDLKGQTTLISVVPNLKTKVCSLETARFNQEASKFEGVKFITISNNPIEFQKNWCAAHGVNNMEILSDFNGSFGKAMHLYIPALATWLG